MTIRAVVTSMLALALLTSTHASAADFDTVPPPPPPSYIWDLVPKPSPPVPGSGPEVWRFESWSADGRHVIYNKRIERGGGAVSPALFIAAVSARSRTEQRFDEAGYKEWIKTHPEAEELWGEDSSTDEHAKAIIEGEGAWVDIRPPHWKLKGKPGSKLRCSIRRDGKLLPSHVFQVPPGAVISTIDVYWSPDGRRIAWLFQGKSAPPATKPADPDTAPKLTGFGELVIDRTIGPRIEIAGDRSLGPETFDRVADAIEKAGFAPTGQRLAKGGPRTIVYTVNAWKTDAATIAAAIPGGAELRSMPAPRSGFEVTVVLGRSLRDPIPHRR